MKEFLVERHKVCCAMPTEPITIDVLAKNVCMNRNELGFILRLLKVEGKVEYIGRHWSREYRAMKSFWKRKP